MNAITKHTCSHTLATHKIARVRLEDRLDVPNDKHDIFFTQLYQKHYAQALQMIFLLDKNCACAEDLVQDIFMKLFQQRDKLKHIESFSNYLFLCVRNRLVSHKRQQKKWLAEELLDGNFADANSADDLLIYKMTSALIEKTISSLPRRRQQVFRMSRLENMSHQQIADQLGIAKITVSEHVMEAVSDLKEQFNY